MTDFGVQTITFAFVGGILPPFIWLWFWLKEDKKHPEPKRLIALAFVFGMIVVLPVFKLESVVCNAYLNACNNLQNISVAQVVIIFLWVIIEEIGVLIIAYLVVLRRKEVDEPIDYTVYLITTALGFAALENALFLTNPQSSGFTLPGFITSDLRFFGATLLHVATAGVIGVTLGFGFYKTKVYKFGYFLLGVGLAVALHTGFNLSIIMMGGKASLFVSAAVWSVIMSLLLILEKVKRIHPN